MAEDVALSAPRALYVVRGPAPPLSLTCSIPSMHSASLLRKRLSNSCSCPCISSRQVDELARAASTSARRPASSARHLGAQRMRALSAGQRWQKSSLGQAPVRLSPLGRAHGFIPPDPVRVQGRALVIHSCPGD